MLRTTTGQSGPLIPGINLPFQGTGPKILLMSGPSGAGKTMYCRQFLLEGLLKKDRCIFISTDLSKIQFNELFFSDLEDKSIVEGIEFINPYDVNSSTYDNGRAISGKDLADAILLALQASLGVESQNKMHAASPSRVRDKDITNTNRSIRLVVDSMTHTLVLLGERTLIEFVMDLKRVLKSMNVIALLTLTASAADQSMVNTLSPMVDGIIEMRLKEDSNDVSFRSIRVRHLKGIYFDPKWNTFKISNTGNLIFKNTHLSSLKTSSELTCALCAKPIIGTPLVKSDFLFDSKECMEIYTRLENAYGSKISDTGLPSEAFHATFSSLT
ncbi:MAG: RAD55 family ATPase [Nitrososphaera sp.]